MRHGAPTDAPPNGKTAIRRVCVVGAGVMGSGIAAQVANGGVPVLLLDRVAGPDRDALARGAVERMRASDPTPFMSPGAARLVATGNIEDDLAAIETCDWIIEAIVEDPAAKRDLYRRLDAERRPGTPISSNTSTIPLDALLQDLPEHIQRDVLITHFFNPPRHMRLMELVHGPRTDPAHAARIAGFADRVLGKTVVMAKDRPGFIANRIGAFWVQCGIQAAIALGLTVEEADAVLSAPFGIPKTGIFGLSDLVGLDLMPQIDRSMRARLPPADRFVTELTPVALIETMVAGGYTGRKGKGGFYRLDRTGGSQAAPVKQSINLRTGAYAPSERVTLPAALRAGPAALLAVPDRLGAFARRVMGETLAYAAGLVPEICDDVAAVDLAMERGFGWAQGPFALIDRIGAPAFAALLRREAIPVPALVERVGSGGFYRDTADGRRVFGLDGQYHPLVRPEGVLLLDDLRRRTRPVFRTGSASLWDIGDGIACFEITTKMNVFDDGVIAALDRALDSVGETFRGLVLYSDAPNFSAGADLGLALFAANIAAWDQIEKLIRAGQAVFQKLKYAPFPVVAAPAGLALGGGCEILLHCDAIQAHAELYAGLVECGVGLVPGWGGCGQMLDRLARDPLTPRGPVPAARGVFEMVGTARVSTSAADARAMHILRPGDRITMNRDRLLADAKARALALVQDYVPPAPPEFHLAGPSGQLGFAMAVAALRRQGAATPHDVTVSAALARILTGGAHDPAETLSETALLDLERDAFLGLIRATPTLDRIEHMLETGKPLRN